MLLTRHKLLLLGLGWFVLAVLALAGLGIYAALDVPLPLLPSTEVALAYLPAPTVALPQFVSHSSATAAMTATTTPTLALVVKSPTPTTTPGPTDGPTPTPPPNATAATAGAATTNPTLADSTSPPAATFTAPPGASGTPAQRPTASTATTANTAAPPAPTHTAAPPPATNTSIPPTLAPPPPPVPIADFWGINGGPLDGNDTTVPLDGNLSYNPALRAKSFYWMNQAGLRWFRNYGSDGINFSWRFVEPAPGVYDWSAWDGLVRAAQQKDVSLVASIGNSVPQWANGSTDWRVKPTDLYTNPMPNSAWYQYVQHVVQRYDGLGPNSMPGLTRPIKFWELWNEPDLRDAGNAPSFPPHQFNGNVADYVRLTQVGYGAVKAADPGAQVVGPSTSQMAGNTGRAPWFLWNWSDWINAGGLNFVDIVSFHVFYDRNGWDVNGAVDNLLNGLDANRGGKPVWLTEVGWAGGATSDYQDEDNNFVRSVVLFWQRPAIQRYFWYDLQESETYAGSNNKSFLQTLNGGAAKGTEPDPLFHPIFRVAQVMARMLAGFGSGTHPTAVDVGGAARAYHFSRAGLDVWVAWQRAPSGTTTINLDTGGRTVREVGLYGDSGSLFSGGALTIGPAPVYLTTQLDWNPNLGTITGRVSHSSQAGQWSDGASGATVTLAGPLNASATTDADGNYVFTGLPDGAYVVAVAGASPASQSVTVASQAPWGRTSFTVTP